MSERPSSIRERDDTPTDAQVQADPSDSEDVSILDLFLMMVEKRSLIVRITVVVLLLGAGYAVSTSNTYVSTAKLLRDSEEAGRGLSQLGGLGAISGGLGIDLGIASGGMNSAAFTEVLQSREVRLAVVRDTFYFPDFESRLTFVEYANRSPGFLDQMIRTVLGGTEANNPVTASEKARRHPLRMTDAEGEAIEIISEHVSSSIDKDSGLLTLSVQAGDPELAAEIGSSFIRHLTDRVRQLRTIKVRRRVSFVEGRFQEAEEELTEAEDRLAQFLERNQNPTTASLKFQEDRLRRQVSFKEQLFSDLRGQLTQARLDLQRQQPVVTVVEEPVPPLRKSSPNRLLLILLSGVIGVFIGGGIAIASAIIDTFQSDERQQQKLDRLIQLLPTLPSFVRTSESKEETSADSRQ